MSNNISTLISSQLPEHIRSDSPLFESFLTTYYQYAGLRKNSVGLIENHYLAIDIDHTLDEYIAKFLGMYSKYMPNKVAIDKRNFIKMLNSIYEAKGTEKAFKLLFNLIFNEQVSILSPYDSVLKASDGIWQSYSFVTINIEFGQLPENQFVFFFSNAAGDFYIEVLKTEIIPVSNLVRLYFKSFVKVTIKEDQIGYVYGTNDNVLCAGKLLASPDKLKIIDPGKYWQNGQVIVIPGATKNTIAKITSVDQFGSITSTEILEHGHGHGKNQTTSVTPYPNKPYSSKLDITSNLVSTNPDVYEHTIEINDFVDSIDELVFGFMDAQVLNSYFLEDYVEPGYVGYNVISTVSISVPAIEDTQDYGITIDQWFDSKTILKYDESYVVKTKGYYENEKGQLSNQNVKLQDNFFYQPFSYLIETAQDIEDYKYMVKSIHPTGTKMFSTLLKTTTINVTVDSSKEVIRNITL